MYYKPTVVKSVRISLSPLFAAVPWSCYSNSGFDPEKINTGQTALADGKVELVAAAVWGKTH